MFITKANMLFLVSYYSAILAIVAVNIIVTVLVLNLHHYSGITHPPLWVQRLLACKIAAVLGIKVNHKLDFTGDIVS